MKCLCVLLDIKHINTNTHTHTNTYILTHSITQSTTHTLTHPPTHAQAQPTHTNTGCVVFIQLPYADSGEHMPVFLYHKIIWIILLFQLHADSIYFKHVINGYIKLSVDKQRTDFTYSTNEGGKIFLLLLEDVGLINIVQSMDQWRVPACTVANIRMLLKAENSSLKKIIKDYWY
jgi:hypothetical protein